MVSMPPPFAAECGEPIVNIAAECVPKDTRQALNIRDSAQDPLVWDQRVGSSNLSTPTIH